MGGGERPWKTSKVSDPRPKPKVTRISVRNIELMVIDVDLPAADDALQALTADESELARMAVQGFTAATMAERLRTSEGEVAARLQRIYEKLDVTSPGELAARVAGQAQSPTN